MRKNLENKRKNRKFCPKNVRKNPGSFPFGLPRKNTFLFLLSAYFINILRFSETIFLLRRLIARVARTFPSYLYLLQCTRFSPKIIIILKVKTIKNSNPQKHSIALIPKIAVLNIKNRWYSLIMHYLIFLPILKRRKTEKL